MTVKKLIEKLQLCPQDAYVTIEIDHYGDGGVLQTGDAAGVYPYLDGRNVVITTEYGGV